MPVDGRNAGDWYKACFETSPTTSSSSYDDNSESLNFNQIEACGLFKLKNNGCRKKRISPGNLGLDQANPKSTISKSGFKKVVKKKCKR